MSYASLADLRAWLGVGDSVDDAEYDTVLASASRSVSSHCKQSFEGDTEATARRFFADTWQIVRLTNSVIGDTTDMVVKTDPTDAGTYGTTITDYLTLPLDGVGNDGTTGWPITALQIYGAGAYWPSSRYGRPLVQVTAKWGWAEVPEQVKTATLMLAAAWHQRRATVAGQGGFENFFSSAITEDSTVEDLLRPYRLRSALAVIA